MGIADFLHSEITGQGWLQISELFLAFVLSSLIGLERETRMKSAGLRTHTVVGVAAALIMLVSKYGFGDVLGHNVILDPSRVAAQIVSGIGFLGAGLIFVRGDAVRGLTTAATIWLTAAVGMACAAGLPILALFTTAAYFLIAFGYTPITKRILTNQHELLLKYRLVPGMMRQVLQACIERGFAVHDFSMNREAADEAATTVTVRFRVVGSGPIQELALAIAEISGVISVKTDSDASDP